MFNITTQTNLTSGHIAGEDREFYYTAIIIEFDNGVRYQLRDSEIEHMYENNHGFLQSRNPDDVLQQQNRRIDKINSLIGTGQKINLEENWFEINPVYGSEAYLNRPTLSEMLDKVQ